MSLRNTARGCDGEGVAEAQITFYCGRWALSIEVDGLEERAQPFMLPDIMAAEGCLKRMVPYDIEA